MSPGRNAIRAVAEDTLGGAAGNMFWLWWTGRGGVFLDHQFLLMGAAQESGDASGGSAGEADGSCQLIRPEHF